MTMNPPRNMRADVECERCLRRLGWVGSHLPASSIAAALGSAVDRHAADSPDAPTVVRVADVVAGLTAADLGLVLRPRQGSTLGFVTTSTGWRLDSTCACGKQTRVAGGRLIDGWLTRTSGWRDAAREPWKTLPTRTGPVVI